MIDTQAGTEDPAMAPAYEAMNEEWQANTHPEDGPLLEFLRRHAGPPGDPATIAR